MSKKNMSRFAAGMLGAALLCMTAAMPVFADPEEPAAETAAETAAEASAADPAEETETAAESTAPETEAEAEETTTTEKQLDPNDPLSGMEYEETADGGIRITKYKWSSAKNIVIPAEIEGKPVTEIGDECFKYCYGETVSLPDTIRVIGERAFQFCTYIERIEVPDGCVRIGTHAFDSCARLEEVKIPDTVTFIGFSAFEDSPYDEKLTDEFVEIGDHILYRYNGDAEEVRIPKGFKYIGEYAFEEKENLKSVKIPDSVIEIYDMAFEGCNDLAKIEVDDSIEAIAPNAVANTKWQMSSKEDFIVLGRILLTYHGDEEEVTVPDGIRVISKQAFNFCTNMTTVHLPDSVVRIGEGAFAQCAQLQIAELGEGLEVIERKAFESDKYLNYVRFGHNLREIGEDAFLQCYKLEDVYLPDTVEKVHPHAFGYQFGEDSHTFLRTDTQLTLYSNTEAVRKYAEEAGIPHQPLPDEENTKPLPVLTTAPGKTGRFGKPGGKVWIPAAIVGGVMVIGAAAAAFLRGRKEK